MSAQRSVSKKPLRTDLSAFDQLDGKHPWMSHMPEGYVSYRVKELRQGKVCYFNFVLAKEMGLIPPNHPHEMNSALEEKILSTFSLQIINEYDELSKKRIPADRIKPNRYMATRYLQLQHSSKIGKTSGDGRGIWNGIVEHKNQIWDVSSRGTGVTCLAPGSVEAQKPLKTGGTQFGYGCGQAEIDELLGAAIMAEGFHLQGIQTERVLCIIDLGKGVGIGVRASLNLLRPAHLFLYLKQNRFVELKKATDYFIERQKKNQHWKIHSRDDKRYDELLEVICDSFARFTAQLDIDYIFARLDWDGDNVLADAGIIDYGSVRQFGIRHDEYRYDDVERFSTNLSEQKSKARLIVQVFAQLADFLKTKKKKSLRFFSKHSAVKKFDQLFNQYRNDRLLYRMGFTPKQRQEILKKHFSLFTQFNKLYSYFERVKISGTPQKVPDGINHPALFNMRTILKDLPEYLLKNNNEAMPIEQFFQSILSGFAKSRDLRLSEKYRTKITEFQKVYCQLIKSAADSQSDKLLLRGIWLNAQKLNSEHRITGNALIQIVDQILTDRKKGTIDFMSIQKIVDRLVYEHMGFPEVTVSSHYKKLQHKPHVKKQIYSRLLSLVQEHREDI